MAEIQGGGDSLELPKQLYCSYTQMFQILALSSSV